ncbi:unnamed protein product [Discula destructiva]
MSDSAASTELLAAAKDAAARNRDYYALLAIPPPDPLAQPIITRDTVQRAWRKRSLKYHPDKAGAAFDKDTWEEFGLARDVLASDEARAAYDGARSALLLRQRERELMSAKQRRFAEELERAEGRGGAARMREQEERARREREEKEEVERGRQAEKGRAYVAARRRRMAEAEAREGERVRREDEARDDRIRELEGRIAEKARRRAEKKAKREGRKGGGGLEEEGGEEEEEEVEMVPPPPSRPVVEEELARPVEQKAVPVSIPALDVQMSDDAVQFWGAQWPKTKARLLAAQAKKEGRMRETQAAA